MRGVIVVETEAEFIKWRAAQRPEYLTILEGNAPKTKGNTNDSTKINGTNSDTTKTTAKLVAGKQSKIN